jgi:hypothetical protein
MHRMMIVKKWIAGWSLLVLLSASMIQQTLAGEESDIANREVVWRSLQYIEYIKGDMPLVIAVPHGGTLKNDDLPDRSYGASHRDVYTQELVRFMREDFQRETGHTPYVIINKLDRIKLDPNRGEEEAAQGNAFAAQAWTEYHQSIKSAKQEITQRFHKGFFVDLHGHRHRKQSIEVGYRLEWEELSLEDEMLNDDMFIEKSSLRNLLKNSRYTHAELLRGKESLGWFLTEQNLRACPSPADPIPGIDEYFPGGYDLEQHVVKDTTAFIGVQLELGGDIRKDDLIVRSTSRKLVNALIGFLQLHWGKTFSEEARQ